MPRPDVNSAIASIVKHFAENASVINGDGTVLSWGAGARKLWSYDNQEIVGRSFGLTFTEESWRAFKATIETLPTAPPSAAEGVSCFLERLTRERTLTKATTYITRLSCESGATAYLCIDLEATGNVAPISPASSQYEQFTRIGLPGPRGESLSLIAHELNQSYSTIQNFAHAAERTLGNYVPDAARLKSSLDEFMQEIRQQCELGSRLVEQMRQYVQGNFVIAPVKMEHVIRQAIRMTRFHLHDQGHIIPVAVEPSVIMILGDALLLEQMVYQLLKNAIEACTDTKTKLPRIEIQCACEGNEIILSVRDNGPGISKELEPLLFQPFVSTKDCGFGMGLTLVKKIASAHHGVIHYERCNQRNITTFSVHFPHASMP